MAAKLSGSEEVNLRIGQGFDVHRLVADRPLILGGVRVPFERGLAGHSDADVLVHAVCDALLGAAGLGDLGHFFPDDDKRFENADSLELLAEVIRHLQARKWMVVNVDATILAERPKLAPHTPAMKRNLARVIRIGVECIGIKASTTERLGFVGRGEGMAAMAVVLLRG